MKKHIILTLSFLTVVLFFTLTVLGQDISKDHKYPGRKYPPTPEVKSKVIGVNGNTIKASAGSIAVAENPTYNLMTPEQLVRNVLVTGCLQTSNIKYGYYKKNTGNTWTWVDHVWSTIPGDRQMGYFEKGTSNFPIDKGLILATGKISSAMGPNTVGNKSDKMVSAANDPDLSKITAKTMYDASTLEFDFVPAGNTLEFKYIFTSEEYIEYCETEFNDAFGFFLSGPGISGTFSNNAVNLATIPGNIPVSINTIHPAGTNINNVVFPAENETYYMSNPSGSLTMQYDGGTVTLTATYNVTACSTYHIKLSVADASDQQWDGAVFLQAKSFNSEPVTITSINPDYGATDFSNIFEGCKPMHLTFERGTTELSEPLLIQLQYSGTAVNGVDVLTSSGEPLPSEITIPIGQTKVTLDYYAVADGVSEGSETFEIQTLQSCPCDPNAVYILKEIRINETPVSVTAQANNILCNGTSAGVITVGASIGSGNYLYSLNGGTWQNSNLFSGLSQGTYNVSVKDIGSCAVPAYLGNIVLGAPAIIQANAGADVSICSGTTTQLNGSGGVIYSWSPRIGLSNYSIPNPIASPTSTTTYTLTVTDANNICTSTDQVVITVNPSPTILISPPSAEICAGSNLTLTASGGTSYLWNPTGATTSEIIITPYSNSSYSVIGTSLNGCKGIASVDVVVKPIPQNVNAGTDASIALCQTYQLQGSATSSSGSNLIYLWTPATGLSNPNIANPVFTPSSSGSMTFTLTVTDNNSCSVTDQVIINTATALNTTISGQSNIICFGTSTGSATVSANGGSLPYSYSWNTSPIQTTSTATGLKAGTYTVTVTDAKNCISSSQVVISEPVSEISFNTPTVINVECTGSIDGKIIVSANGGTGSISYTISPDIGTQSPAGTFSNLIAQSYTISATDEKGCNKSIPVIVGTLTDITLPTIIGPANVTATTNTGCTATGVALGTPVTADNCGVALVTNNAPAAFPIGITTITWTVTDNSGNKATCDQTVTVSDNILPTITCPANVTATTNTGCTATGVALGTPVTSDNCGVASVSNNAPAAFPLGITTVTWTVTDNSGNKATCDQTVTVSDNILPTITCPANVTATTNTGCTATGVALGTPITADNCGVASVTNNAPAAFPIGITTVTWTVTDNSGNKATCDQTVTVSDNILPTITCPANVTATTNTGCTATGVALGTPLTTDNCGVASVSNNAPVAFPIGITTVTWTVTDNSGNKATCDQTVTVSDNILPTITCPTNVTATTNTGCTATGVALGTPVTADNCGVASVTNNAPAAFPIGITTVTWTVTDNSGNKATCDQTVTVSDNILPTITCPTNVTATTNTGCTATGVALGTPVTADNCGVASVTNNAPAAFPLGITTVTWTVTDNSGNKATCDQTVTVSDNILPTITCPTNVTATTNTGCTATGVALGTPVTSDNCGVASVTNNAPAAFPIGITTVTWTVTDNSGNKATCDQTVTVSDNILPTITCPTNVMATINTGCTATGVALGTPVTSDNCGVASVTNNAPVAFPIGITTVTWTVTDNSGNKATCDQTVTVSDNILPTITCPANVTATTNTGCTATGVALGTPLTTDNCGVASVTNNAPVAFPIGITTVTWTVTDNSGNKATCDQTVTVSDNILPTITCPANVTATTNTGCTATGVALGTPVTADNCGVASVTNNAPAAFPLGITTVTWTVTDNSGNKATCDQTVTVSDNIPPTITCPTNVTATTNTGCTATGVALGTPVTSDNCGVASVTNNAPAAFPIGATTVIWTVTDNSGNKATCNQTVTVSDNVLPTIACPANVTATTNTGCTATGVALGTPVTSDNCGVASVTNNAPAAFPIGITTVTWTVTDNSGNKATCDQTVTVSDNVLPTIACPANVTATTNTGCTATGVALGTPVTADNCGVATVSNNAPAAFPIGITTVTWTVTDNSGNKATCDQTVTVSDNVLPTIACPANVTATTNTGCTATGVALGTPVTADNCGVATVSNNAPAAFPIGITTVTWTVTDNSGNKATCDQTVTVSDNILPTITCPANVTATTNTGCTATGVALGTPVTSDNCSVASVSNNAPAAFPIGITTVTWTVTDNSGNKATCDQTVTVSDNIPPTITCATNVTATTNTGCTATGVALGTPVTSDNCGVASVTNNAPVAFPIGITTVTWTVTDNSGNKATCDQTVTVSDNILPTITCPTNVIATTNTGCTATGVALGTPVTSDNCGVASVTNNAPAAFPIGATTVIWTVTDNSGNKATCDQTVTVSDNILPTITCPANVTATTNTGCTATGVALGTPVTSDCSVASVSNNAPAAFPIGITTVTWTVTDNSGNKATCDQTVTVSDNILPTITCPANVTATTNTGCTATGVALGTPVTADNCGVASVTNNAPVAFPIGITTVTWTVTDNSGNKATCDQTVTVSDTILPTITCPTNVIATTNTGCTATGVALGTPVTSDNCGVASVTNDAPVAFPIGITTVTWTVTDNSGNKATCDQTVTVSDNILPTITCPTNVTATTNTGCTATGVALGTPVTADNCGVASVTNNAPAAFPIGITTVTWTVTDNSGNKATCDQTVTVSDSILPTITCPTNVTATTNTGCTATGVALGTPVTADNCGVATVSNNAPAAFPIGITTVTWTVTDNSGNKATCDQTVTVSDNIPPTITCPANVTATTNTGCSATGVALGTPVTSDNCGVALVTNNAPAAFPIGATTVIWTVTDNSGNKATCDQTVTVSDNILPTITCLTNVTATTNTGCTATGVVLGTPLTTDNCGVASVTNNAPVAFPLGITTVTWTVTDNSGNKATCDQTVTVSDNILPTITCPANVTATTNTGCTATGVALGTPVTADNCGVALVTNNAPAAFPIGITTVTWTVTDNSGNKATCDQTVTVSDNILPTITCPANVTATTNTGCTATGVALGTPVTSDNCGVATVTNNAPVAFPIGITTVTWTVTDNSGNKATCDQTVTVSDNILPAITCPVNVTTTTNTGCTATGVALGTPVTSDNCSVASVSNNAPAAFPIGITTVTWTVTDNSGNKATCDQTVTVSDNIPPTITCATNVTATTNTGCTATGVALGTPVTSDNCGVALVTNNAPAAFPIGITTVTWTVTDNSGNKATCDQTVTVSDNILPTITCPANVTATTNTGCTATGVALGTPVTADNCGVASVSNNAPAAFPLGITTVTWTVTDNSGNKATCDQTVTVSDNILPTITCPANVTATTNTGCTATGVALGTPVTADNCGVASVSNNAPAAFPIGITTVTWTVTDNSGNKATCDQTVTVSDNILPTITCPTNVTATTNTGCTATGVALGTPVTADNCGVASVSNNAPAAFPIGITTVTWTVTDNSGNKATCDQTVTVSDNILPTITCPANVTSTTNTGCTATGVALGTPVTADNCGVASVSNNAPAAFPIGITTVTWTVTDNSGNKATCDQTVTVSDNVLPTIACPANVTATTNTGCTATGVALGTPVTADNCGVASVSNNAPAAFPIGITTVTWTVTDNSGNKATCDQTVTVSDNILPTITCPTNITATTNTGCTATGVALGTPVTADNCGVASVSNNAPAAFPIGITTVTWTVTDNSGNKATCDQTVTVSDNIPPTITCPTNVTATTNTGCTATGVALGTPVTADNCGVASVSNNAPAAFPIGITTVTWTVTDNSGNKATCDQTVTVSDNIPPTITCPANVTATTNTGCSATGVALGTPVTADNCGVATVSNNAPAAFPLGITTVTWTVTDNSGNKVTCDQTVTVSDNILPTITCPANITATTNTGCTATGVALGTPVTADNCGVASVTNNAPVAFPIGITTVTWTVTDNSGNKATCDQTVTVSDNIPPTIVCPAAISVSATIGFPYATGVNLGTPVTSDNCGVASVNNNAPAQFPVGSTTVTWTVTDVNGLSATCTQMVIVTDTQSPVMNCPATILVSCINEVPASYTSLAEYLSAGGTVSDNDGINAASFALLDQSSNGLSCPEIITRIYTVADINNNFGTCSQQIIVHDKITPVIAALPAETTINCPAVPEFAVASATDNCGSDFTLTFADVTTPGACAGSYSVTRTWTATDACGNTSEASQKINVQDVTAPVIAALPAETTINCPAVPEFAVASATDNCGSDFTLTFADVTTPGACAGSYSVTRTWTATDACGNTSEASQKINVQDVTAPVIAALPAETTINCPAVPEFAVASATDNCGSDFTLTFADITTPGACAGSYSVTRTWTATDACGNTSEASQKINVQDVTAPVIAALPAETTINCPAVPEFAVASATDNCGSDFTLTFADITTPGACAGSYSVTRTWTATDACGNTSEASQKINVQDVTAPVIAALPAETTINCPAVPEFAVASATDNCGSDFTLTFADVTTPGACAGSYSVTRTWTATDACGNTSEASQKINVQDVTAPVIAALPAETTVNCPAVPEFAVASATDNCGSDFTLTSADVTTPGACAGSYSITRTWTATDACGNTSEASQKINVQDVTAPVIAALPAETTVNCPAVPEFAVASATDNCGSDFTLTFADVTTAGACAGSYSVTRTWTATDACGNMSEASQKINVQDVTAPVVSCPANITVNNDRGVCGATVVVPKPTVAADCSSVTLTNSFNETADASGLYPVGTTSIVWTVKDNCGNTSTCSMTVTVTDTEVPVVTCPANIVTCSSSQVVLGKPTATDNCGDVTFTSNAPATFEIGTTSVIWTATDIHGNSSTCTQTVTVSPMVTVNAGEDQIITSGTSATLICTTSGGSGEFTYTWSPSQYLINNNNLISNTIPLNNEIIFTLTALDVKSGCSASDEVKISMDNVIRPIAVNDFATTLKNTPVKITILANDTDPIGLGLNVSITDYPKNGSVIINEDGTITYTPAEYYIGYDTLTYSICDKGIPSKCAIAEVIILTQSIREDIEIYNLVTPDGDGKNDYWHINGIEEFPDNEIIIFNRWGTKVREFVGYNNTDKRWDGKNEKNEFMPDGVYFYIIKIKELKNYSGWVYVRGNH